MLDHREGNSHKHLTNYFLLKVPLKNIHIKNSQCADCLIFS